MKNDKVKAGDIRMFLKSGNMVRVLEKHGHKYYGQVLWEVERVSSGKRMLCPEKSLVYGVEE